MGVSSRLVVTLGLGAVLGRLPDAFAGSRPTLAELDSAVVPPLLALFQQSAAGFDSGDEGKIDVLDAHGDVLLALGRTDEALARWQQILDEFPTTVRYDQIEAKIKEHS